MQHRELRAHNCPRSFERMFEFQCGTVNYIFITGLKAREVYAETSKKMIKTGPKVGPRRLGADSWITREWQLCTRNSMRDLPEWMEELTENVVEAEASILEAAGPRDPSIPEPLPIVEVGKHSAFTHFTKDRNCATSAEGLNLPVHFSDNGLVTQYSSHKSLADKVLYEQCESSNSHWYAVIVQVLVTPWLQAHPCKTKTSQETEESSNISLTRSQSKSHLHR